MTAALRFPSMAALEVEAVRRWGFREFVKLAWPQIESARLQHNWHLDAIGEHLTALHKREIRELVINIPPGCSKSLLCSVLFPAWVWTLDPEHRWLMLSYDQDLALRDGRKMRTLVTSEWYRARWPAVELPVDRTASTAAGIYFNTRGGMRISTTLGSGVTGKHANTAGIDDPIDTTGATAASGKELDRVIQFTSETLPTRFVDPVNKAWFCVMQRLHERDLAAEMIRNGATVLCLPMEFEAKHPHRWARDPRGEDGELLHPTRFPAEVVVSLKRTLGPTASAAQLQQRPSPAGGGVFKADWFKRWVELPVGGTYTLSIDCTFKQTTDGSYVVIQCWYQCGPNFYLVDQHRERMDITQTMTAIVAMSGRWPQAYAKLIEDKANGPAVVDMLKAHVPGLELVEPHGGKEARANAVQPLVSAGNVFVPEARPDHSPAKYSDGRGRQEWVEDDFISEVTTFPKAANDDQTDGMTQFLNYAAPHIDVVNIWQRALKGA